MQQKKRRFLVLAVLLLVVAGVFNLLLDFRVSVRPAAKVSRLIRLWYGNGETAAEVGEVTYEILASEVVPPEGKTVLVEWGDMGKKLVAAGAIDLAKFEENYGGLTEEQREILTGEDLHQVTFTRENIGFWTNVLWALGLTQKSKVLDEGPMATKVSEVPVDRYASTAGWTLGSKDAMALYSSRELIELTAQQEDLVYTVASKIFRPCCGNSTAYPDCNHGMAVLGLLELMVSQGAGEEELYQAALAFNGYAFEQTYITMAAYFKEQGKNWSQVDATEVLGEEFSSGQGAANIYQLVGEIPGAPAKGASCGA